MLLSGITGSDICHEALSVNGIQIQPVYQVIASFEGREIAHNANSSSLSFLAMLAYCQSHNGFTNQKQCIVEVAYQLLLIVQKSQNAQIVMKHNLFTRKSRG